MYTRRRV